MTRKFVVYLILIGLAIFTAFPFLWTIVVSLKTRGPIFSIPPDLSLSGLSIANYTGVWKTLPLPRYALNSLYIAAMGVSLTLVICSLAAYPLALPARAMLAIFRFVASSIRFLWPVIILKSPDKYPLAAGLRYLRGLFAYNTRYIAAGIVIATLPVIVVFLFTQRYFMRGLTAGAIR